MISLPKLENFIKGVQDQMAVQSFEGKRQALDGLGIVVWLDCESVEVTGVIPAEEDAIVTTHS